MAYQLDRLADNRLQIFDQSRLPITDILSVLSFIDTDNRYSINCRCIGKTLIYRGKITEIQTTYAAENGYSPNSKIVRISIRKTLCGKPLCSTPTHILVNRYAIAGSNVYVVQIAGKLLILGWCHPNTNI